MSLSIPLIVIATPIWYLHWRMAQRAVDGDAPEPERRSVVRSVFFALILLVSMWIILSQASSLISTASMAWLGGYLYGYERDSVVTGTAIVIILAIIWAFHFHAYSGDVQAETHEVRQLVLPQIGIYLVTAFAAIMMLFGLSELLRLAVDAFAGVERFGRWWRVPLSDGLSLAISGALVWGLHLSIIRRLRAD